MSQIGDHFSVYPSEIEEKQLANDDYGRPCWEIWVKGFRVGTGSSKKTAIQDAIKNGQYALDKVAARNQENEA